MNTTLHNGGPSRSGLHQEWERDGGSSGPALPWESIIWNGIALSIPSNWEMLQFSRNPEQGRCAFADRYQFRLELNWRQVDGPPDFDRMLSDYSAQLEKDGMPAGQKLQHGEWQGLEGSSITRWGRYMEEGGMLIELVFPWPEAREIDGEAAVLDSLSLLHAGEPTRQRWRAFGMDLSLSDQLELAHCDVRPAHAEWVFHDRKARTIEHFTRRGMVSEWLEEPVTDWLKSVVGSGQRAVEYEQSAATIAVGRHTIATLSGTQRLSVVPPRKTHITASAWICPNDGRLYSVIAKRSSTRSNGAAEHSSQLSCCPEFSS